MEKELVRSKVAKKATLVGFWANAVLTILKLIAGFLGNSAAMVADGVHSLSDFLTDIIVLISFKLTEKPEDDCHNYGHEKYETLATVLISVFLFFAGYRILRLGVVNIIYVIRGGILAKPRLIALLAASVSIVCKECLFRYTRKVGENINSQAVIANAWHHRSDTLSSIGTFIGIGGAILLGHKWTILDPIASIVVSLFIFKVAVKILIPAINELLESALTEDEIYSIKAVLENRDDIEIYHKLRTRRIGNKVAIEFHILVDSEMNITEAHNISTEIENEIKVVFGEHSIVTIHIEPSQIKN